MEWLPVDALTSVLRQGVPLAMPTDDAPSKNSTLTTRPPVLIASAVSAKSSGPSMNAHAAGLVTMTTGAPPTVTVIGEDWPAAPLSSVARALSEWTPGTGACHVA